MAKRYDLMALGTGDTGCYVAMVIEEGEHLITSAAMRSTFKL